MLILLILGAELVWIFSPHFSHGLLIGSAYRYHERMEAIREYIEDPSPANKETRLKEYELLRAHVENRMLTTYGAIFLTINGALIFCFWKIGAKRKKDGPG